nr:hypothetical protein [Mycobacterium uberis]
MIRKGDRIENLDENNFEYGLNRILDDVSRVIDEAHMQPSQPVNAGELR